MMNILININNCLHHKICFYNHSKKLNRCYICKDVNIIIIFNTKIFIRKTILIYIYMKSIYYLIEYQLNQYVNNFNLHVIISYKMNCKINVKFNL